MRSSRIKSIAQQIGMLGILTAVVAGLTILFNLFATIGVSVLAGMMAGASRRWNLQVITVSFLPAIVALAVGFVMKVPFDPRHFLYLTGMCLGSFWGTWIATFLLMSLEEKNDATPEQQASACLVPATESPTWAAPQADPTDARVFPAAMTTSEAEAQLNLDDLQGTWLCDAKRADEPSHQKLFVVDHGKFSLSIMNGTGQARLIAQGELIFQDDDAHKVLLIRARSEV